MDNAISNIQKVSPLEAITNSVKNNSFGIATGAAFGLLGYYRNAEMETNWNLAIAYIGFFLSGVCFSSLIKDIFSYVRYKK